MGCPTFHLNPQSLHKRISAPNTTRFSLQPNLKLLKTTSFSSNHLNQPASTSTINQTPNVNFKTLGACKLGISRYPDFSYNAAGGAGSGTATKLPDGNVSVEFDVEKLYVPPLSTATTTFLGLPLPPFLKIDVLPRVFRGEINQESGKVDLKFIAEFCFSVGSVYKARPLLVETVLTSDESKGKMREGRGERMDEDGKCRLVGVATVDPINDLFLDTFLSLPTECLADLNAVISFSTTQ
ncbi:hypothetical protein SASPL_126648 [Salvia splendens]|uniref:Uncharacterized protein n=1 Tax=Salvia splendens TaxID=180675 RepID=A0A8X8XI28_SALSN|nr:uncharacterized protein LOC121747200 [Salvia splendens]KAG6413933.1 hypothetical protein SASPL_126648 [Salvia splendens]